MADKIKYTLEVDDSGFIKVVKSATDQVSSLTDKVKKSNSEGSSSLKNLTISTRDLTLAFNGAVQMVSTLFNGMKQFTEASNAQIQATKTLTEDQIAYSKTLEDQTGVNDTIISQAQTQLKVMGLNNEETKLATKYVADLVSQGISLEDSMRKSAAMVTKNYGELGELIPAIKMAKTEQEKQSLAIEYFNRISDKSIEKMAGAEGAQIRLANAVQDTKEEFGLAINNALIPFLSAATPVVKMVGENMPTALSVATAVMVARAIPAIYSAVTALRAMATASAFASGGITAIGGILGNLAMVGGTAYLAMSAGADKAGESQKDATSKIDGFTGALENQIAGFKRWSSFARQNIYNVEEQIKKLKIQMAAPAPMDRQGLIEYGKLATEIAKKEEKLADWKKELAKTTKQSALAEKELATEKKAQAAAQKAIDDQLLLDQKTTNDASSNLQKEYQQKIAQIGKEGYELEKLQAEQANQNILDNLKKMLGEKKIHMAGYSEAIKGQNVLFNQQMADIDKKYNDQELAEQKKKNEELIKADEESVQLQIEAREKLNSERIANDISVHEEVMAMQKDLTDKTRTETEKRLNDLQLAHDNEATQKKALYDELKLSQTEYEAWVVASEEKLSRDRQAIYIEYSQEIANILGNSFKDLFVFPDNTEALNQLTEEQETLDETYQARLEAIDKEMKLVETSGDRKAELIKERMKLERDYAKQKESITKREAELDKDLSDKFIDNTKTAIKAAIDMLAARGAAAAFASALESVPFPFNLVAAPIAYTGAYVAISAAKNLFRKGGYTGDGNPDDEAGIVHKKEFVATAETTDRVGIPALEALQDGKATIVPITPVSKPDTYTGSVNAIISNRNNSTVVNPDGTYGDTNRDVVVINNSDFVSVSRTIENKRNSNRSVLSNRRINEI